MNSKKGLIFTGSVIGLLAVLLVKFGNPGNMGICVACFIRDTAGALGLHSVEKLQYIRPEIIGFILGAFVIAKIGGEFNVQSGSSPFTRFFLGVFVMIGALVFLGCPLRMVLRLAGGDLNAIVGILGFAVGILVGTQLLKKGFTLGRAYKQTKESGYIFPLVGLTLLVFLIANPSFIQLNSAHAPWYMALGVGLIVGILAQKSRICMVGGIRDAYLIQDYTLLIGFIAIFFSGLLFNNIFGLFKLGFLNQPAAHTDALWNFLGMFLAGYGSVLLGGCPLRQTILAAQGNMDSAITFFGFLIGGGIAHNFILAASGAGVGINGKVAVIVGIIFVSFVGWSNLERNFA